MGHTRREIDPKGAEKQDERTARILAIREKIRGLSLMYFEVKHLRLLTKLFEPFCMIDDDDLQTLQSVADGAAKADEGFHRSIESMNRSLEKTSKTLDKISKKS